VTTEYFASKLLIANRVGLRSRAFAFRRLGMGNMLNAHVAVRGTRPILLNRFGPDSIPLESQEKTGVAGNDPEEWRKTALVTRDGQIYIPSTYAFATIRNGAKYTKKGRGSIQPAVSATLQIISSKILLDRFFPGFPNGHELDLASVDRPSYDADDPVYLDVAGVVNRTTKGRNVRYRVACSPGWRCEFDILWDKTIVSRSEMEAATRDGGRFFGFADGRGIGFGRFELESFEASDAETSTT
jgi:hypothetical protein